MDPGGQHRIGWIEIISEEHLSIRTLNNLGENLRRGFLLLNNPSS